MIISYQYKWMTIAINDFPIMNKAQIYSVGTAPKCFYQT